MSVPPAPNAPMLFRWKPWAVKLVPAVAPVGSSIAACVALWHAQQSAKSAAL